MKNERIELEVTALWMHYSVIKKMTGASSENFEDLVSGPAFKVIPADLQETFATDALREN
jgi:hypothetical protein